MKSRGFSLVEVLLAVSIFGLMVTALVGGHIYGQQSTVLAGQRARATMLADEGLEAVRNIRDENFSNLTDGTHGLSSSGNQWSLSGSQDINDIFTRQIVISTIDAKRKSVTANVTWQQNQQRTGLISLVTYLTNWLISVATPGTHIAYYDLSNGDLKYASCDADCTLASNWTTIIVDSNGNVGQYISLSFDGDKPRIAYYDFSNKDLKYASCDANCTTSSNWIKIAVDSTGDVGQNASLVLDSGKPRIAYRDFSNKDLKYASCDSNCTTASNWTIIAIDAVDDMGQYASLALDAGKPRIAYYDFTSKNLRYATCDASCTTASNWTKATIDSTGTVGEYVSLTLDAGKPRIAYYDGTNKQLKYATCDASCTSVTNWTFTIVDTLNDVGEYASLVLDAGKPRIAYYDASGKTLKFSSCDANCTLSASWTTLTVDTTQDRGQYASLALDASNPRVSYHDISNKDLRYASCDTSCTTASNWTKIAIDTTGDVGKYSSLNK